MLSLSDRYSDGNGIANTSQIIAVTAPDTVTASATAAAGRTPYVGETPIHVVTYVSASTREAASTVVAEPANEWMGQTSTIEGIDLDAEVPCEGLYVRRGCRSGDLRADLIVRSHSWPHAVATCTNCWQDVANLGQWICRVSGRRENRDEHFRIVEVLR